MNREFTKSQSLAPEIQEITQQNQDDVLFLLALLRNLEQVHRQIRTTMFETSLPKTRNDLYNFVKDIEEEGGWPYIERMKLQELLKNIPLEVAENQ
jgi:predicted transcriptional regulator